VDRPPEFTQLWLRFCDRPMSKKWTTHYLFPKQYWTYGNRTFDLAKARLDTVEQENKTSNSTKTRVDLPVYGAIALTGPTGKQVAVYFRQTGPSLQHSVRFEVENYAPETFRSLDRDFFCSRQQQSSVFGVSRWIDIPSGTAR
jgi:hypothetical protein